MTIQVQPFAFDRVFGTAAATNLDAEALRLRVEQLELELFHLRGEVEAQVVRARAEGFQAALDQVRGERQAALLAATDALHAAIEALDARFDDIATELAREGAEIALAAADHIAGEALAARPIAAIEGALDRALRQLRRGQPITIRVHPDLVAEVEALIAARQAQDRRRLALAVVADPALALGDAQLVWDDGGLGVDATARRAAVARELDQLLPPA
jgi:flagellar assembly protein FliH